ncbi:aryl-alcohol dehydrogenase [Agrocybe pediades]|nr:aryl-alcohol dehydrogenase [Agrocybe pediades]
MAATQKKMPYVRLGNSGLKVSKMILGCQSYGSPEWQAWVLPEEEALQHIKAAYDAGVNAFDTANIYSNGQSEIILGKAIKQFNIPRDEIVVMTKVFFPVGKTANTGIIRSRIQADETGYVNQHGLNRKHIFESIKHSLKRLQLDYVDVLQCHRFDPETPIAETMQALHDVVQAGYARYIGMSSCWAWQFHVMQNYAITNKLTPFISMQSHYNLIYREEEREMFPTLKHFGVGTLAWAPLGRGTLARPNANQNDTVRGKIDQLKKSYKQGITANTVDAVEQIAKAKGVSMSQVALAWALSKGVSAALIGATSLENLLDLLGAIDVKLSEDEIKQLETVYVPQNIIGHA